MAQMNTANAPTQLAASLHVVRGEIENALDHAAVQLDNYSADGDKESLKVFLEEVRQLRGTFKMLDFRAGERLCEELTETVRLKINDDATSSLLDACTRAIMYIKRYIEFVMAGQPVAPSLLIPTINLVRRERHERPLPEGFFFVNNLRPRVTPPEASTLQKIPYRRVRQMVQLGLLGLIRGAGRRGPLQVLHRAVGRVEGASRGTHSWLFWHVVSAALDALDQENFEMTTQRITLLGSLDRMIRELQSSDGGAFQNQPSDAVLKDFLYLVSLAEPETEDIKSVQSSFQLQSHIREKTLRVSRDSLGGPDQSALLSFARALQDEIESLKDIIDRSQRNPDFAASDDDMVMRLERISDTLMMVDMDETASRADHAIRQIRSGKAEINVLADEIIRIEQDVHAITQSNRLTDERLIDPVTLKESNIAVISESITALVMVKRAVAAYVDSGDKLHVKNVGKSLHDVSGAVVFLERSELREILIELEDFITYQVLDSRVPPTASDLDAFADAVTAIEYYLDTFDSPSAGGEEALRMAKESMEQLRTSHVAN